jgi:hypothetical protein
MGLLSLPAGWDGDDSRAPQRNSAVLAVKFLGEALVATPKAPRLFASGDGEICLSWESEYAYAQVSFHDDGEVAVIARSADGELDVRGTWRASEWLPDPRLLEIICTI